MKFSVLLPTRNRLDLLARAIQTVLSQDYENWEIIVSDNFSEEDVNHYIKTLNDPRIKYFRTDAFIPVTDNWNNALKHSTGDYVIMLGDDDGLLQGYFSYLAQEIAKHNQPDFICTNALMYAYPNVIASEPDGFLLSYKNRELFNNQRNPYFLDRLNAINLVKESLYFRVMFDYNMQFFLVSKNLIERMSCFGDFYQSPYPDYYAANAIMLYAERVLIVPRHCVVIGISPKSFGYYYFNDMEEDGTHFLKNIPKKEIEKKLEKIILPGSNMNTSWLISMETLVLNFEKFFNIEVSYKRYRILQALSVYVSYIAGNQNAKSLFPKLTKKLTLLEKLKIYFIPARLLKICPEIFTSGLSRKLKSKIDSHPAVYMPRIDGDFQTILDVIQKVKPDELFIES